jgi:hypothetical protein
MAGQLPNGRFSDGGPVPTRPSRGRSLSLPPTLSTPAYEARAANRRRLHSVIARARKRARRSRSGALGLLRRCAPRNDGAKHGAHVLVGLMASPAAFERKLVIPGVLGGDRLRWQDFSVMPALLTWASSLDLRVKPTAVRLTFRSPLGATVFLARWSMRSWESVRLCAKRRQRLPRSHGPSEGRVDCKRVNLRLMSRCAGFRPATSVFGPLTGTLNRTALRQARG